MTTTTLARGGDDLIREVQAGGWYDYINGGDYNEQQQDKLAGALMAVQEDAFNAQLPAGCRWHPHTGEITGPAGTELDIDIPAAMEQARETAAARLGEIERTILAQ